MEINYIRQHNDSFMILNVDESDSGYEEKMIFENDISALLKYKKININGNQQYHYCISRKENLEDFLEARELTMDVFQRLILNIQLAYEEIAKYLINENHIFLSKETVFLEKSNDSYKVSLCYYPKEMGGVQQQFRQLMEYFLKLVRSEDRMLTEAIYNAYDLCLKNDFTFGEVLESLQNQSMEKDVYVEQVDLSRDDEQDNELFEQDYIIQGERLADIYDEKKVKKSSGMNNFFGMVKDYFTSKLQFNDEINEVSEDFIIEPDFEIEEKTVLLADVKPSGKLVYDGSNQEDDFLINKDIFRIGSGKTNDAVIHEKTVSANHAKIVREGEEFYLSDLNSTNSTYINNQQLTYRKPVKLKIMDKISFANVNYIFL